MRIPFFRRSRLPKLRNPDDKMSLRDHLAELRVRLVRSVLAVILGFAVIIIVSLLTPAPKREIQELIEHVRYPNLKPAR